MSVNRYEPHSRGSVYFNSFGWLVRYDDYQKLQVENKALKNSVDELLKVANNLLNIQGSYDYQEYQDTIMHATKNRKEKE